MWNWVKEKVNKIIPIIPNGSSQISLPQDNPRLDSYLDYRLNEAIISYIEVDNTRLYFQAFNKEETVQTLQEQYVKFHGKEMSLENNEVKISPSMPLDEIITSSQNRQIFQEIVQKLESKQKISMEELPMEKKENFIQMVKKCNEYHSYVCKVLMKNGLRKPLKVSATITADTTFRQIIKNLNTHPLVVGDDIEFLNEKGDIYDPATYHQTFENLGIREEVIQARYSYQNSLLRKGTQVSVKSLEGKEVPIQMLQEAPINEEIISYNSKEMRMDRNKLGNFNQKSVTDYYRLIVSLKLKEDKQDHEEVFLQATGSLRLFVLTQDFDEIWLPVERLDLKHKLGGVHPRKKEFAIYQIDRIDKMHLAEPQQFYGLEVLPAHQFIANRLIVHNCDSFTIKAKYFGTNPREEEVRFYRSDLISTHFGDRVCQVGGFRLNNRQTFGDYQLDQFKIIYIFEGEHPPAQREHTISEWRKESIDRDNTEPANLMKFNAKLKQEYFGIYQQRIIPSREIDQLCKQNQNSVINVLVALRMHFQRINYYTNKEPKFINRENQVYNSYREAHELNDKYKKALKGGKEIGLGPKEVMGIYLYTTDVLYRELNTYLRDDYVKDDAVKEEQFLPMAGWIARGTKKAQSYRGITHRGVRNIDIRKALNLDKYHPEFEGDLGEFRDKFIIFTNFTSTSKEQKVATSFLNKQQGSSNCLLKLIVTSGHQVQKLSQYPDEKEVLILPFTYFIINNYSLEGPLQTAELEEIPMPETNSSKLIFWVDDEPQSNIHLKQYFEEKGAEVVQITSTRIMKVILQNFFWIFKMLGRKVVIISDMVRKEYGVINYLAGVDLFQHIFNDYGLSNKAIIFASDKARAERNLHERGVIDGNWVVLNESGELIEAVESEFRKMSDIE